LARTQQQSRLDTKKNVTIPTKCGQVLNQTRRNRIKRLCGCPQPACNAQIWYAPRDFDYQTPGPVAFDTARLQALEGPSLKLKVPYSDPSAHFHFCHQRQRSSISLQASSRSSACYSLSAANNTIIIIIIIEYRNQGLAVLPLYRPLGACTWLAEIAQTTRGAALRSEALLPITSIARTDVIK
jgi:hypothetical protein